MEVGILTHLANMCGFLRQRVNLGNLVSLDHGLEVERGADQKTAKSSKKGRR